MDKIDFDLENKKYSGLWSTNYGEARYYKLLKELIKLFPPNNSIKILDAGCGNGKAMKDMISLGYNVIGVDISEFAIDNLKSQNYDVYHTSLDNLKSFSDGEFDLIFCNDVLEHIQEKYLSGVLNELIRVCSKTIFLSVSPVKSHHKSLDGEELHLTVKSKQWWELFLSNFGLLTRVEPIYLRLFNTSLRYRLDIKN